MKKSVTIKFEITDYKQWHKWYGETLLNSAIYLDCDEVVNHGAYISAISDTDQFALAREYEKITELLDKHELELPEEIREAIKK
jgi:hypothetical protein